jgi:O-antigen ligase
MLKKITDNRRGGLVALVDILMIVAVFLLPVYMVRFTLLSFPTNALDVLMVAGIAIYLMHLFSERGFSGSLQSVWKGAGYELLAFGLILIGLALSMIWAQNYRTGLGVIKSWFVLPFLFSLILLLRAKENERLADEMMTSYFYGAGIVSALGAVFILLNKLTYDGRLTLFFRSPNQLSMFLAPALMIGIYSLIIKSDLKSKDAALIWGGSALIALNLLFTFSYGAWLACGAGLLTLFYIASKKRIKTILFALVIFGIVGVFSSIPKIQDLISANNRSSIDSRSMIWQASVLIAQRNPFFGIGPGNFQNTYLNYQKYFPPYLEWAVPHPHNIFLAFYLEAGFFGIAGFIWLILIFLAKSKKAMQDHRLTASLYISLMAVILVQGFFDTTYWRNDLAVFFWVLIMANTALASKTKHSESRPN